MSRKNMQPITRRRFLGGVAGSAALAALPRAVFGQASAAAPRKPNVLFIMSDDMRVELGVTPACSGRARPTWTPWPPPGLGLTEIIASSHSAIRRAPPC